MLPCTIPTKKKEKENKKKGEGEKTGNRRRRKKKHEGRQEERNKEKEEKRKERTKRRGGGQQEGRFSLSLHPSEMMEEKLEEDLSECVTARKREMLLKRERPARKLGRLSSLIIDEVPMTAHIMSLAEEAHTQEPP